MKRNWLVIAVLMTACQVVAGGELGSIALGHNALLPNTSRLILQEDEQEASSEQEDEELNPVEAIVQKFMEEQGEFRSKVRSASAEEREELYKNRPTPAPYIPEMQKIAEENPKTELAESACMWLVAYGREFPEVTDQAYKTLLSDFVESENLHDICLGMRYAIPSPKVVDRLDTLINESPHDLVKAKAIFTKACYLEEMVLGKQRIDDPTLLANVGEEGVEYLKGLEIERESIEALYETVIENYPDVEVYGSRKLGALSESSLYALRNLSIGCIAPEIEAADLDGKEFKLSDYRGKVVMIDFWGDW